MKHLIGGILEFLTLYGDRFAIVCFGAALAILVLLVARLVRARGRRRPSVSAGAIAPATEEPRFELTVPPLRAKPLSDAPNAPGSDGGRCQVARIEEQPRGERAPESSDAADLVLDGR